MAQSTAQSTYDTDLVITLSRAVVQQLAPEELPLFRVASQAYLRNPQCVPAAGEAKDDMLGFGPGEAVALLTPVVLPVAAAVISFLIDEVGKALRSQSAATVQAAVTRLFQGAAAQNGSGERPPALTPEQFAQVRAVAFKKARLLGLSESRAKLLADAITGGVAVQGGT
jgi:hypothetical protein